MKFDAQSPKMHDHPSADALCFFHMSPAEEAEAEQWLKDNGAKAEEAMRKNAARRQATQAMRAKAAYARQAERMM